MQNEFLFESRNLNPNSMETKISKLLVLHTMQSFLLLDVDVSMLLLLDVDVGMWRRDSHLTTRLPVSYHIQ